MNPRVLPSARARNTEILGHHSWWVSSIAVYAHAFVSVRGIFLLQVGTQSYARSLQQKPLGRIIAMNPTVTGDRAQTYGESTCA
jgi:hypothetical protein